MDERAKGSYHAAMRCRLRPFSVLGCAAMLAACNTHQSALAPFGRDAGDILNLAVVMLVGAVVIAVGVAALMIAAARAPAGRLTHAGGMRMVLWAGAVVPAVVLFALLLFALPAMRPAPAADGDLRIAVTGEQFWWRVRYAPRGATPVDAANELRLPVGRSVVLELGGRDVVHSFWVPGLAGKMDMIPGRTNQLVVRADRPGRFRGVCTEFCGLSHALMAFDVVAMEPAAFDRWLASQRGRANPDDTAGAATFAAHGCGGCHSIRGTDAAGRIGPDLTHFGSRHTLAAGVLPMTTEAIAGFVRDPAKTKPGVRMPAYPHLSDADAASIARYLRGLE